MPPAFLPGLLQRLARAALTLLGITLLAFVLVHLIPGDPVQMMAGTRRLDPAFHAEMLHRLGLDRPLPEQYLHYLGQALRGDLGRSLVSQEPVLAEFLRLFPATLELTLAALALALLLGVPAGVAAAAAHGRATDRLIGALSAFGSAVPVFWWGLLLVMAGAVGLARWSPGLALPVAGRIALEFDVPVRSGLMLLDAWLGGEPGALRSALSHLLLPAIVLGTAPAAMLARMTRASMLEALRADYIRTAEAKGLRRRRIVWQHALRNALLPLLTVGGILAGSLLGGAVFTERVFAWPGVGSWLLNAIARRDYPVLQGGVLITATVMVLTNLLVDLLYAVADPRLRH